jgi:hypothetical protein
MTDELFPTEFRHEQVTRLIKGLVEGSIKIRPFPTNLDESIKNLLNQTIAQLINDIGNYVSGKLHGQELENLEQRMFTWLTLMKIGNALDEEITETQIEREIRALHQRIDSTNMLLLEIMTLLKEFTRFFDKEK